MAYCSVSSILLILPGLPQTSTDAGYSVSAAVIGRHITRADGLIDASISKRYAVPISPTPPLLASLSEDITSYYSYRSFYTQDNYNKNDYLAELKDDAIKTLNDIREGVINLVDTAGSMIAETTSAESSIVDSTTKDYQPFFDVDDDLEWKFDDDLLDSKRGDR